MIRLVRLIRVIRMIGLTRMIRNHLDQIRLVHGGLITLTLFVDTSSGILVSCFDNSLDNLFKLLSLRPAY